MPVGLIRIRAPSAYVVAAEFAADSKTVNSRVGRKMKHYVTILRLKLLKHTSGRPGPEVRTGDYQRSLVVDTVGSNQFQTRIRAYSTAPQSDRLEWGFVGTDRLGRRYNQPPFPHFGPAFDEVYPDIMEALGEAAVRLPWERR